VTNAAFQDLPENLGLRALSLNSTQITDAAIEKLAVYKDLHLLEVRDTAVTAPGLKRLPQKLRELRIER
jgi:hypothetical protein